jgi:pimeloyl-ACP methyl ester carboxylesterase
MIKKNTENYFELPDGRQLCYAEYGDPSGKPIFAFHGNPNARLLWGLMPGSPFLPNIRIIAPDRPGFGRTNFVQGVTTVENWPNDVVALADALDIEKFAIFAPSGGGPFGLSCAWQIPERLTAVGIFASVGPFIPETAINIVKAVRAMWTLAPKFPRLFKLQMKINAWLVRKHTKLYIKMIKKEFGETDREVYERLNCAEMLHPDRLESYRQGGIGSWYDIMLPSNWPIPLEEIKAKVYLWHGEKDISAPLAMGQYMAKMIPNCEAEFIKDAGHMWVFEHLSEMLEKLLGNSDA